MIPILEKRLEEILNRFSELESELSNTSLSNEIRINLSKEHNELNPIVLSINELKKCKNEIEGVDEILNNDKNYKVIVTFHPAYLLRKPDQKKFSWEDLKIIRKEIDDQNIII